MAFRLFGRSTKKSSTQQLQSGSEQQGQPPPSLSSSVQMTTADEEGFTVVSPAQATGYPFGQNSHDSPIYPVKLGEAKCSLQKSLHTHYLDGVPFVMTNTVKDSDELLSKIENVSNMLKSIDLTVPDYDFSIERTVLTEDLTATMRRLHAANN